MTKDLGCETSNGDRDAKTAQIVQSEAGYVERVLKTFGMWNDHPVKIHVVE